MRPGRLPETHPLEQRARDKLRAKPPINRDQAQQQDKTTPPTNKQPAPPPRRWI